MKKITETENSIKWTTKNELFRIRSKFFVCRLFLLSSAKKCFFSFAVRLSSIYHLREIENFSFTVLFFFCFFVVERGIFDDIVAVRKVNAERRGWGGKEEPLTCRYLFFPTMEDCVRRITAINKHFHNTVDISFQINPSAPSAIKVPPLPLSLQLHCKITLLRKKEGDKKQFTFWRRIRCLQQDT